jgi:hypothetical protein
VEIEINAITYKIKNEEKDESAVVKYNIRYGHWEC